MSRMRLQKFLAQAGIASRRKAEELIERGKITVNGMTIVKPGTTIDPERDLIMYQNKEITLNQTYVYYAINKPEGYISSTTNNEGKSVIKLVSTDQRIYPVGRLDKETTGLLIVTNDGEFTQKVTHARHGCTKEYFVVLDRDLAPEDVKRLQSGMKLRGKRLQPIKVTDVRNKSARLVLSEGVYRQIRGMMGRLGYSVKKLKRIRVGKLELGTLKPGQSKKIKPSDVL